MDCRPYLGFIHLLTCFLISAAGYAAIFVSVDLPVLGTRPNETRNKFAFPTYVDFPNLKHISEEGESEVTAEGLLDYGMCFPDRPYLYLRRR